jgi:hypothetical protein
MLNMVRQQQQQNTQHQLRAGAGAQPGHSAREQPTRGAQPVRPGQQGPAQGAPGPPGPSLDNFRNFAQTAHHAKVSAGINNAIKGDHQKALEPGMGAFEGKDDAVSRLLAFHSWSNPWNGAEFDEVLFVLFYGALRFRFRRKR